MNKASNGLRVSGVRAASSERRPVAAAARPDTRDAFQLSAQSPRRNMKFCTMYKISYVAKKKKVHLYCMPCLETSQRILNIKHAT
ncbi:hypothetical protein RR46_05045 [Papilio xuthus]|uniref:Uncharacterized protein n=1 Tax=Papilio xuthus TaxID=66420 RepID=A0A194Q0H8_PAPXU|nr:hypothetical protein RR46_05045 [Papilio xuthus]